MHSIVRRLILAAALFAGLVPVLAAVPPPVPGLPDTERRISYSITVSTCACNVNFALYGDTTDYQNWVEVFINGVQVQYNDALLGWTITSPTGPLASIPRPVTDGVLTFNSAQTGTIQIVGARRPRRVSQFNENTGVPARNLNQVLTDIVAMLREVWDKINDVTGRVARAPPGETMTTLPPAATRANKGVCFDGSGNIVPCVITSSGAIAAGNGIALSGTNPVTITDNVTGASPIVITGTNPLSIGCPTCSTFTPPTTTTTFVSTRAAAAAQNLSTFNVIITGGYATAGDGGAATFKNVGTAAFIDSFVTAGSIVIPGSGCTNGTYYGVALTGGNGTNLQGTAVISGGVLSSFTVTGVGGNAYLVNDVLSLPSSSGACSTTPTWKVTAITTPSGSFTDSAGTHFQYTVGQGNYINTKQFGAAINWTHTGGDAGATNDTTSIQNALNFAAAIVPPTIDGGGSAGNTVIQPTGNSLVCALQIPFGVKFIGVNSTSSLLKECDALAATSHFITLCDPNTHLACFGAKMSNMRLFPGSGAANSNIAMVYSNNVQQMEVLDRVFIFPGPRACILWDIGYGGAASVGIHNVECDLNGASSNAGILLAYGAAVTTIRDSIVESSGFTGNGVVMVTAGGIVNIDGFHSEGITSPIFYNVTTGGVIVHIENVTGGSGCTSLITRQGGSIASSIKAGSITPNGCTNTLNNAGAMTTGNVVADVVF